MRILHQPIQTPLLARSGESPRKMTSNGLKDMVQSAVQLNKDHQFALKVYTERLEAELEAVDKLLVRHCALNRSQYLTL